MRPWLSCSLLIGLMVSAALPAAAAKRVALVIGNSAYENAEPLPNPVNDSRAVADALRRLDFVVIEAEDEDKAGMQTVLRQFIAELEGADASVFFYAGHGLQVQGRNYLVPVDAALESEVDLPFEALAVEVVLDLMEQTTPTRLVFLDACRNNPLARRLSRAVGKSRSLDIGRGLARMNSRVGTLIAFATEPDKVALDGTGEHSPFTHALLDHIETPGIEVRQMLSRVRATVIDETDGEQLPLDTSALVDDFYFAPEEPEPEPVVTTPAAATPVATSAVPGSLSTEHLFWQSIQTSGNANDFEAYLASYPDGAFASLARNRLNVLSRAETEVAALRPTETPPETPIETPVEAPQAAPTPAPAPEPLPEPVVEVEVEPLDTTVVATRNVNVRGAPNTDGDPFGVVAQGTEVAVVGKVVGANWYRIRQPDGGEAYVYAPLFVAPEALVAQAAPAPAPSATPPPPVETAATAPAPAPMRAEAPVQTAAAPVQMAAVVPNAEAPVTRAHPMVAPMVDAGALLQAIGERKRNSTLQFRYRIKGEQGRDFVAFDRWEDSSTDEAPRWSFGDAGGIRVQSSSETFGQAVLASQVGAELFGVLMSSQATHGGRATFMTGSAASALEQWAFLDQHGAQVQGTSSLILDGVQFEVAALALNPGAPADSCLGFVGIQVNKRVDGYVCRLQGAAFDVADASAVLSQMTVPRLIEP